MNILIIEDEEQAAQRLESLVRLIIPGVNVLAKLDTVRRAVEWFTRNPPPDLVFMDIQLADGIGFMIFDQCEVASPIIFTTAYDEYALKAFKVNSIDYILKPVDKIELEAAINKFRGLARNSKEEQSKLISSIGEAMKMLTKKFKTRFVVKVGEHLRTIEITDVQYFYSQDKTTFCTTCEGRKLVLDYTLEQLEDMVDPERFYRINRKYLISSDAIADIISYTNSRLKVLLKDSQDNDVIVARERVQDFKSWLDR
ncbi:MAG TPA: LytTR family DNA-binding domain-containing protein [Cyclobacteriaceae bacterium]|nr:LytTR family DNA-binding domain-containing protein [Cyclobacteriaceae bacterium]